MQNFKRLNNAVLIYLLGLICFVVINVFNNICVIDIVYLITLVCAIFKYFKIMIECRK